MIDQNIERTSVVGDDRTIKTRRVLMVANPKAGGFSEATLTAIEAALVGSALHVETRLSAYEGDIRDIVSTIGEEFDVVAVHGGDGSINEAVAGLRQLTGRRPALAIIAGGTANVLASETGASRAPADIAQDIIGGRTTLLHYGSANGRPFVLMASVGLDAAVVHRLSRRLKAAIGKWAYVAAAVAQKLRPRTPDLLVKVGGNAFACRIAICSKASRYGGDFVIAPETHATRAGFQLVLLEDDSAIALLRIGWRLLAGKSLVGAGARILAADDVEIVADPPSPAQLDGDPFGTTPLRAIMSSTPVRLIIAGGRG